MDDPGPVFLSEEQENNQGGWLAHRGRPLKITTKPWKHRQAASPKQPAAFGPLLLSSFSMRPSRTALMLEVKDVVLFLPISDGRGSAFSLWCVVPYLRQQD